MSRFCEGWMEIHVLAIAINSSSVTHVDSLLAGFQSLVSLKNDTISLVSSRIAVGSKHFGGTSQYS